jgi:pyruvate dehydrogenase (quinone)
VEDPAHLDVAVRDWLATPGPALLDVVVERSELVMPPVIAPSQVLGMAMYSVKGVLAGRDRARGVFHLIKDALIT